MSAHNDDIVCLQATELKKSLQRGDLSSAEVVDAYIERIETVNPYVNAVTATVYDRARHEAREADARLKNGDAVGILHGLPIGIKDLEATEGLLTTLGSPIYRNHIPDRDNILVARLRSAGAIVLGKTNVPELGAGANTRNPVWGATGNPFNPSLNCGGSSGGSAVALATDMFPMCSGSDTGGSLRIPAALCSVVGLRTSPGLVPVERRPLGWTPISVVGPMGRTVGDVALQLAAVTGVDDRDPLSYEFNNAPLLELTGCDLGQLRVGWTEDFGICEVDEGIRQVFRAKIAAMQHMFSTCEKIEPELGRAHWCFDVIRAASYVARYKDVYETAPDTLGESVKGNYELGARLTLSDHAGAHKDQTTMFRQFQQHFQDYDIILAPTTPVSPFPWTQLWASEVDGKQLDNYYRWLALTYVTSLTINPTIALPCGSDHMGMPFGIQVIGRYRRDTEVLNIALSLEQAWNDTDDLKRMRPDMAKLLTGTPLDFKTGIVA